MSMFEAAGLGAIKCLVFVYDVISFPFYYFWQKPWVRVEKNKGLRSEVIQKDDESITYHSLTESSERCKELQQSGVTTMEMVLSYAVRKYGDKKFLGTRDVLDEEDEVQPDGRRFKKFVMGEYKWQSFNEVNDKSSFLALGLLELGHQPRGNVVVFAETRAEWLITAFAGFKQSLPLVTLYATLGEAALVHGITETSSKCIVTSNELLPKVRGIISELPEVEMIVFMEGRTPCDRSGFGGVKVYSFSEVLEKGKSSHLALDPPSPEDVGIIMYTSGSTGNPKGVVLTHQNLLASMLSYSSMVTLYDDDVYIGYLPLAHVLELLAECMCSMCGVQIGYSTPLTMLDISNKIKKGTKGDTRALQPTLMAAVPLILDRVYKGIQDNVHKSSAFKQHLFRFAYEYRRKWLSKGFDTPVLNRLVFRDIRKLLGGKVDLLLCGGAPLSADTHEFLQICMCCPVLQGYGLTESTACASLADEDDMSYGRVGGPLPCCNLRIVNWEEGNYRVTDKPHPRGEIVLGGENIANGYYKLPGQTKEEFFHADGRMWFKTGDIGEVSPDGILKIIDRKKDLVKLQFGEYVSLGKVEAKLKLSPIVDNICVYGDSKQNFTVALIVPVPKVLQEVAESLGLDTTDIDSLYANKNVEKEVLKELQVQGKKAKLERFEIPQAVTICKETWTPDTGLVTAAFKLRRKIIEDYYSRDIKRMYAS